VLIRRSACGWDAIDETLVVHETTGQLLDFLEISDAVKRDPSSVALRRAGRLPSRVTR
jgi:hypothetical protein